MPTTTSIATIEAQQRKADDKNRRLQAAVVNLWKKIGRPGTGGSEGNEAMSERTAAIELINQKAEERRRRKPLATRPAPRRELPRPFA